MPFVVTDDPMQASCASPSSGHISPSPPPLLYRTPAVGPPYASLEVLLATVASDSGFLLNTKTQATL